MRLNRSVRKGIAIAVIALLSVTAVILSVLALSHTRTSSASADAAPAPTSSPIPMPSSSPTPTATPSASPVNRADERFLSFAGQSGWRATAGSCAGAAPVLQRLDAQGQWVDVVPRDHPVGQIASLDAYNDGAEFVAGVDEDCTPSALRTFSAGAAWAPRPDSLAHSRYVDLHDAAIVHSRIGELPAPCAEPRALRARGDVVALVCDEQAWLGTGEEWTALPVSGVKSVAIDGTDVLVGHSSDECSGLAVTRVSDSDSTAVGCAQGVDTALPLAMAPRGANVVVWAADEIVEVTAQ